MYLWTVSGVNVTERLSWMSGCSIHMHLRTETQQSAIVTRNMKTRKREHNYEQRIRDVEHSSFTPFVLSATGDMAKQSTTFYKRLASHLAEKWEHRIAQPCTGCVLAYHSHC